HRHSLPDALPSSFWRNTTLKGNSSSCPALCASPSTREKTPEHTSSPPPFAAGAATRSRERREPSKISTVVAQISSAGASRSSRKPAETGSSVPPCAAGSGQDERG